MKTPGKPLKADKKSELVNKKESEFNEFDEELDLDSFDDLEDLESFDDDDDDY